MTTIREERRVSRSLRSARQLGARFERAIADYLAEMLEDLGIDRQIKTGNKDRGDIRGVKTRGQPITIECKNCATTNLSAWIREAHLEAGNSDALCGIVIAKRKGTTDPEKQWVHMELGDLVALITGHPQPGRYE